MNIKYWLLVTVLTLGVIFVTLDSCGSSAKLDRLREEYKKASEIAEVERRIKEEIIKENQEEIVALSTTIVALNTTITKKDRELAGIEEELGENAVFLVKDAFRQKI